MSKRKKEKKDSNLSENQQNQSGKDKTILKFALGLAGAMILFFAISYTAFFENYINLPIVKGYANVGNWVLNLFGLNTVVEGTHIKSSLFDMNIGKGCDAVSPTILFMAAILVYPTSFDNKWKWVLAAPFAFGLLNLVRILSLYFLGAYVPSIFEFAHIEFWQGVFILMTILAWFYWLISILQKNKSNGSA